MPKLIPADPTPVPAKVPTPHNRLRDGWYQMEWCGYVITVRVQMDRNGEARFLPPSGYQRRVSTVPDASFYRLPEALQ